VTVVERPCLVLLHAFPVWSAMYDDVRAPIAAVADLVTPDFRGFGAAALGEAAPSLNVLADDVAALLDARGVDRAVVGGTSMGGYVAMAFCRRHPDRLAGLVLADTKAGADTEAAAANRERIAATVLAEAGPRVLLDDVYPGLLGTTTHTTRPELADRVRRWVQQAAPGAVAWAQRAMAARPDSTETLRATEVPALVLVGDEDGLTPPEQADAISAALPRATSMRIPAAGHLSAVEAPDAFAAAVVGYLTRLRSG